MKLSKNKLRDILKEELEIYINSLKSEKLISEIQESINQSLIEKEKGVDTSV
tara:strand:+ start:1212 stop:1367 length:156 start_codon:yes stop_codon:yes gene_type:complete